MEDRNVEFRLSVWHGNKRKDIFTIQNWIANVQKAKGTTPITTTTKPIGLKRNFCQHIVSIS
jgi:hypothetical protein